MLPILAVLFVAAHSAVAAPSTVAVSAYPVNDYPVIGDSGRFINSYVVDSSFGYLDTADMPFYVIILLETLKDMANSGDIKTQASAVINTIVTIGELVSGIPGDACENAALVNAYAYSLSSGNKAGLQQALGAFVGRLNIYIDLITQLLVNPRSVKFTVGPRGNCLGGGRTYQFEEAWGGILDKANPYQIGLYNEEYCAARRMYNAFSVPSNNVAAGVTAASIPPVVQMAQDCLSELGSLLRTAARGENPTQVAGAAKAALNLALGNVSL